MLLGAQLITNQLSGSKYMNVIVAIIAGVVGTAAMIVTIMVGPAVVDMSRLDVTIFVGTAFTPDERRARAVGWLILSFNGSVLAIICALLWEAGFGSATWLWGLIFGAVLGIVTVLLLPLMMRIHPRAEEKPAWPARVIALSIWLGHLVYGLVVALIYGALS